MDNIRELGKVVPSLAHIYHKWASSVLEDLGLYRGQPYLLYALQNEDGLTHSELSEKMGISAPTVTKMVQRMESNGLLSKKQDSNDMRISRVYITKEGQRISKLMDEAWTNMTNELYIGFSDEEITIFKSFMERLRKNIENAKKKKSEGKVGE